MRWQTTSALLLAFVALAQSLSFELDEGSRRCFLIDVPDDTLVVGSFKVLELNPDIRAIRRAKDGTMVGLVAPVKLDLQSPDGKVKNLKSGLVASRFAFTTQSFGEHLLCLMPQTDGRWFGSPQKMVLELELLVGAEATDYEEVASRDSLTAVELEVRRISDKVRMLRAEQNYERVREHQFRDFAEENCSRVAWFSVLQIIGVLAVGAWQIYHLRTFFIKKKLG